MDGPSDTQMDSYFWSNISKILRKRGFCVSNVWKGEHEDKYSKIIEIHKKYFSSVFEVYNSETSQVALYGGNTGLELILPSSLSTKALELQGITKINYPLHLKNIRRIK